MTVVFDAQSEPQSVTAVGNVRIEQPGRTAFAQQAVYTVTNGLLVLTGEPRIVRGADTLRGAKITFKRDQDRVLCEGDVTLRIAPGSSTNFKDIFKP